MPSKRSPKKPSRKPKPRRNWQSILAVIFAAIVIFSMIVSMIVQ